MRSSSGQVALTRALSFAVDVSTHFVKRGSEPVRVVGRRFDAARANRPRSAILVMRPLNSGLPASSISFKSATADLDGGRPRIPHRALSGSPVRSPSDKWTSSIVAHGSRPESTRLLCSRKWIGHMIPCEDGSFANDQASRRQRSASLTWCGADAGRCRALSCPILLAERRPITCPTAVV